MTRLGNKQFFFTIGKKIGKLGLAPLCVSTCGQWKFGPLFEILNMSLLVPMNNDKYSNVKKSVLLTSCYVNILSSLICESGKVCLIIENMWMSYGVSLFDVYLHLVPVNAYVHAFHIYACVAHALKLACMRFTFMYNVVYACIRFAWMHLVGMRAFRIVVSPCIWCACMHFAFMYNVIHGWIRCARTHGLGVHACMWHSCAIGHACIQSACLHLTCMTAFDMHRIKTCISKSRAIASAQWIVRERDCWSARVSGIYFFISSLLVCFLCVEWRHLYVSLMTSLACLWTWNSVQSCWFNVNWMIWLDCGLTLWLWKVWTDFSLEWYTILNDLNRLGFWLI